MLKVTLLVLAAVTLIQAQVPHQCVVRPQLSFRARQFNQDFSTFREFSTEYDGRDQRVAMVEQEREGTGVQRTWLIMLHQEHRGYEYNLKTKKCKKFQIGPFFPWGVPQGAIPEADFTLGGPGESLEVVVWKDHLNKSDVSWRGEFSHRDCYPVRIWEKNNHDNHSLTTDIFDLVEGIMDPYAFIPPQECLQGDVRADGPSEDAKNLMGIFKLRPQ